MIQLIEGLPDAVVGIEAVGQVEAADYDAVAAPAVKQALEHHPKIRIIHVLDDRFEGYTAGGAWQDAVLGLANARSFDRIAVVTDSASIRRLATIAGWSIPGELQLFSNRDRGQAEAWASEGLAAPRTTDLQGGVR
jgi:SpoIIAA-like